jgi:hypothetical protein
MAQMVQVTLVDGNSHRVCWVPTEKGPKLGSKITLKNSEDPERLWSVMTIGESAESSNLHTDWKVGGI